MVPPLLKEMVYICLIKTTSVIKGNNLILGGDNISSIQYVRFIVIQKGGDPDQNIKQWFHTIHPAVHLLK